MWNGLGFRVVVQALVLGVLIAACANQKEPAQAAINDIESAVKAAGADAQQYAADKLATVNQGLARLKASFDQRDYKAVTDGAPAVLASARSLHDDVTAGQARESEVLDGRWKALATEVPTSVETIGRRLASLRHQKPLPHGVTRGELSHFASSLDAAKRSWERATADHSAGRLKAAVDSASQAETATLRAAEGAGNEQRLRALLSRRASGASCVWSRLGASIPPSRD